jgi:hypothetical protein
LLSDKDLFMDVSLRDFLRFSVAAGSATDLGTLVPLALYWRGGRLGERGMTTTAALVLLGGFFLRLVIVFSAESL